MSKPKHFVTLKKKISVVVYGNFMTYCFEGSKNTAGCYLQNYDIDLVTVWRSQTEIYMKFLFFYYFHFSVQKSMYIKRSNYLHFYYVFSKILHIEYLKNT